MILFITTVYYYLIDYCFGNVVYGLPCLVIY
jgi:hypothetical protein